MKNNNDIAARMQRLFDLWGKFDRVYFKILHRWNLSYNAYLLLEELYHHPEGLEPAATADHLSIPRQTMTFVLDSLEREGHLERLPHPADRRRKLVTLTPRGRSFGEEVVNTIFEKERAAMDALSPAEQEQLLEMYERLQRGFERSFLSETEHS